MSEQIQKSPRPKLYEKGSRPFWTVPYISKQMLEVHLDSDSEKASRKPEFMDASVKWINSLIPQESKILDLGCGPGLYLSRLAQYGHQCMGIDFSENSIEYAKSNQTEGSIVFQCGDYLDTEFGSNYETVILVYCDFGVLSFKEQSALLKKINSSLREGGRFILDVYTNVFFDNFEEEFESSEAEGGFWNPGTHRLIKECYKYPEELVTMGQYHLITNEGTDLFRIWSKCYLEEEIDALLNEHGFKIESIHADICGNDMTDGSETMGIVCVKI